MNRNIEDNDPVTEGNIPWYLKIPIEGGDNNEEGEWYARPYFGDISIDKEIKIENDVISQDIVEENLGIKYFEYSEKPSYLSNSFRVQPQNKLHSQTPRRVYIPFDEDESEEWHYSLKNKGETLMDVEIRDTGTSDTETYTRKEDRTMNENVYSNLNILCSQSEPNILITSPELHTSGELIGGSEQKEDDRTKVNKLKHDSITELTNHDQYLHKALQKKELSLLNAFPSTDIRERPVIVDRPHHRKHISTDASNGIHLMSDYLFAESPEFQTYSGAIDDILIQNSKQERAIEPFTNHNQFVGRAPQEQSPLNNVPSTYVHERLVIVDQSYHRQGISTDASNDIQSMPDYLLEEFPDFQPYNGTIDELFKYSLQGNDISRNREETVQFIIQCLGIISLCVYAMAKLQQWLHRRLLIRTSKGKINYTRKVDQRNDKTEGLTELSATIENGDCGKFKQDLAHMSCTRLLHEDSKAFLVVEKCETEDSIPDLLLDQATSFSSKTSSTLRATIISPAVSKEVLADDECGLENSILDFSLDQSVPYSSDTLITKPALGAGSLLELREDISSEVTDSTISSVQASMSGPEVADYIKTLTSSFSREGLDNQAAFQLAQMALEIKYKEMSEIRRIQLEERRRNEDMLIEERRHQQKIKAMSQELRNLRDEAQQACRDLRDGAMDMCIGKHQIMCIVVTCGIRALKQNWRNLKELTMATKTASVFELISVWACNCTENISDSNRLGGLGATGSSYALLVLRSLVPHTLSSVGICSALCILRTLFCCLLFALVHKGFGICKSPQFVHHLLNCTVFTFTALNTDIGNDILGSATMISVINFVIAIVAYTVALTTAMKGCNKSVDDMDCQWNTINLASKITSYSRLISTVISFAVGFISV